MTEAEAKTKWCPFARLSEMGGTYNRCGPSANLECIGSACMAWRKDRSVCIDRRGRKVDRDIVPLMIGYQP